MDLLSRHALRVSVNERLSRDQRSWTCSLRNATASIGTSPESARCSASCWLAAFSSPRCCSLTHIQGQARTDWLPPYQAPDSAPPRRRPHPRRAPEALPTPTEKGLFAFQQLAASSVGRRLCCQQEIQRRLDPLADPALEANHGLAEHRGGGAPKCGDARQSKLEHNLQLGALLTACCVL